jgi:hypothetical protein
MIDRELPTRYRVVVLTSLRTIRFNLRLIISKKRAPNQSAPFKLINRAF